MSDKEQQNRGSANDETTTEQNVFKEESDPQQSTLDETENKRTMSGLDENIAAALCYVFSIITGVVFLVIEKENRFIRFHAMQAIFTFIFVFGAMIVLNFIPILGTIVSILLSPFAFLLTLFLIYQAYKGRMYKLPFIGDLAEKNSIPK